MAQVVNTASYLPQISKNMGSAKRSGPKAHDVQIRIEPVTILASCAPIILFF